MDFRNKNLFCIKLLLVIVIHGCTRYEVYTADTDLKEGSCPVIKPGTVGTCDERCSADSDCNGTMKCCNNGCGHVCKDPVPATNISCPTIKPTSAAICMDACSEKEPCADNFICCTNGCGHVCIEQPTAVKSGETGEADRQDSGSRFIFASPLVILLGSLVTAALAD